MDLKSGHYKIYVEDADVEKMAMRTRNMRHIWSFCGKGQRKQVICQIGKEQICKFGDGLLGTCVVLGRSEAQPKEN